MACCNAWQGASASHGVSCFHCTSSLSSWKRVSSLSSGIALAESQRLVVDVTGATSRTAHLPLLFAVRQQLELERLPSFHGAIMIGLRRISRTFGHGRHCVFAMHVHLVSSQIPPLYARRRGD